MTTGKGRVGILVGGGPAPGINSAISAATIEASNAGFEVLGLYDGFQHLVQGRTDMLRPLIIADVSRIYAQGGSILRTSRTNPARSPEDLQNAIKSLKSLGIAHLITIGGDDTAFGAREIAKAAEGTIRVAHVPKTIDNDLPLPASMPTFGFETARHVGTNLVLNLMEDSRTTNRWFFAVVMGRRAGHLALGIGKSAGATLTVIPEEFPKERVSLDEVCTVLEGAILKRRMMGRSDGLAVIAEGVGEKLDPEELAKIPGVEVRHDPYGHISLSDIPLAAVLQHEIEKRFSDRGDPIHVVDVTLGYELRCAPPCPFDIDYTRTLGYGAANFLASEPADDDLRDGCLVCLEEGFLRVLPFDSLRDPETGRTRVRLVDIRSEHYKVAREYMIRLEREDLENPDTKARIAETAKMPVGDFERRFAAAIGIGELPKRQTSNPGTTRRNQVTVQPSPAKWHRLRSLSDEEGRFNMLAIDQRGSLEKAIAKATGKEPGDVTADDLTTAKRVVTETLAPYATAVLTDPEYGYVDSVRHIPAGVGLLLAYEQSGHEGAGHESKERKTHLLENWSVEKAQRAGADAVKLLIYYRPDGSADVRRHQLELVERVGAECEEADMPFLLEPVSYPILEKSADSPEFAGKKPELVIESAAEFSQPQYKVDILKLEFPADLKHTSEYSSGAFDGKEREAVYKLEDVRGFCRRLNDAAAKPWVILSAGVDISEFLTQVELATQAGASGFLCGRAIWKDAINLYPDVARMEEWLRSEGAYNFVRANAYAHRARPWFEPRASASVRSDTAA